VANGRDEHQIVARAQIIRTEVAGPHADPIGHAEFPCAEQRPLGEQVGSVFGFLRPEISPEQVGGLLIEQLGHIPHKGERVTIGEAKVDLIVVQMRGKRVVRVKLVPLGEAADNR